jgi:catechol 2,3-dioxygenase-like lactoylglutathione lyase family enzyme
MSALQKWCAFGGSGPCGAVRRAIEYVRGDAGRGPTGFHLPAISGRQFGQAPPKTLSDRAHRKQQEHLDAHIDVIDIEGLYEDLQSRGAQIVRRLEERPWAHKDFYVEDPDGYILCFSAQVTGV